MNNSTTNGPLPEATGLTHIDAQGSARMVDVGAKPETPRLAIASGRIRMSAQALAAIRAGNAPKGDVLGTARIAGIMAAKRTGDLVPMCHPLALDAVSVDFDWEPDGLRVTASASLTGRTGVEMEAIVATTTALVTVYDMAKALDKGMVIDDVRLIEKRGGKSGHWRAQDAARSAFAPPLALEEAQARLIALSGTLPVEIVPVENALGRYLAGPLAALRTQPAADLSAMDGYAVRLDDSDGPWNVIGESAAGHPFAGPVSPGEAIRVSTGSLMPADCGCVILQEDIARDGPAIEVSGDLPRPLSKHVRHAGLDFSLGDEVLGRGVLIGPAQAALAVSAGHAQLPVHRLPGLAVIDSGDELSVSPDACEPHQIPASNGLMLLAMMRSLAGEARRIGPVADNIDALVGAFRQADDCDVIVTSGGASVGDHDLVRPALEALGARLDFWRVAIKPGKPLLVATREREAGRQIIVGLPGNPVSSFVTAFLFVLPLLRAMAGAASPLPRSVPVRLGGALKATGGRREFVRAAWDGDSVIPQVVQDSGALASLAASNVLVDRPANAAEARPGDDVRAFLIGNGGIA